MNVSIEAERMVEKQVRKVLHWAREVVIDSIDFTGVTAIVKCHTIEPDLKFTMLFELDYRLSNMQAGE